MALSSIIFSQGITIRDSMDVNFSKTLEDPPCGWQATEFRFYINGNANVNVADIFAYGDAIDMVIETYIACLQKSSKNATGSMVEVTIDYPLSGIFVRNTGETIPMVYNNEGYLVIKINVGEHFYFIANGDLPWDNIISFRVAAETPGDFHPYAGGHTTRYLRIEKFDILLGESKYYYAVEKEGKLKIHETTSPNMPGSVDGTLIENASIWDNNPVVQVGSEYYSGLKVGVYWETQKPKPTGTGNLPPGMIRLIGRYWHVDSVYKVSLTAKNGALKNTIFIEVMKPTVLGDPNLNDIERHSFVRDVFASPGGESNLPLDEVIMKYAGENGIPPQIIKGQMDQECRNPKTNVFEPVWRYEPLNDLRYQNQYYQRFYTNSFVKTTTYPAGIGDWPTNHTNVLPSQYPYSDPPKTIGGFIADNWGKYRRKGALGQIDTVIFSKELTDRYEEIYERPKKLNKNTDKDAKNLAFTKLGDELREGKSNITKKYKIIAQTRISSSYGFTQIMYTTAIDDDGIYGVETENRYGTTGVTHYMNKSDIHQYPEKLNEQNISIPIYCDKFLKQLKKILSPNSRIPASQWNNGFEANWKKAVQSYNSRKKGYSDEVMQKSQNYLPH